MNNFWSWGFETKLDLKLSSNKSKEDARFFKNLYQSELQSEHLSRSDFFNISLLAKNFIFTIEDKMIVHFVNIMCCKYYVSNLVYFIFSKDSWRFSAWYIFLSILSHEAIFLLNILKCSSRYDYLNETSD